MSFPLTTQPMPQSHANTAGGWMPVPAVNFNCPPGLAYLTQIDQLLVHQKVELFEAMVGVETANKYVIKNSLGQQVYYASEESDFVTRNLMGPMRPFEIKITDNHFQEVIHLRRPCKCVGFCCYPCCMQEVEVMAPPGTIVGYVRQKMCTCKPKFDIQNAAEDTVLRLEGPCNLCSCCSDINFPVYSRDGQTQVGKITKQWTGLARETFTDADHFGINFPMDLDVNIKAVLLGALFLIDFLYFESNK